METLALSSRLPSFSLGQASVAIPTLARTTRHQLSSLSHRSNLKCLAATLSSSTVSVRTVEKEEQARLAYAVEMGSNLVPLYRCIFCDHLTPILAYRCLVQEDDIESPSFLFESVEQGLTGTCVGRYSVIGAHPAMEIVAKENVVSIVDRVLGLRTEEVVDDPMVIPQRIMEGWSPQFMDELPDVFCGFRRVEARKRGWKEDNEIRGLPPQWFLVGAKLEEEEDGRSLYAVIPSLPSQLPLVSNVWLGFRSRA